MSGSLVRAAIVPNINGTVKIRGKILYGCDSLRSWRQFVGERVRELESQAAKPRKSTKGMDRRLVVKKKGGGGLNKISCTKRTGDLMRGRGELKGVLSRSKS